MKQSLYTFIYIYSLFIFHNSLAFNTKRELLNIKSYLTSNLDSAFILSKNLLEHSLEENNDFGIVKANLYLGYIHYRKEEHGKSVLYFLEGIRQADKRNYEGIEVDKIWLRRNLGNTFMQFESNSLATKYNLEAIAIAEGINNIQQIVDVKYNQGIVYLNNKQYQESVNILKEILPLLDKDVRYKSEIINQIGIAFLENQEFEYATEYFIQLQDFPYEASIFKAKALHNLGEVHFHKGETDKAIKKLLKAVEIMEAFEQTDNYSLFLSYRNLGVYLYEAGKNEEAKSYLSKAEELIAFADWDASSFQIYRTFSNIYYDEGNDMLGREYSEIYFNKVQEYLKMQEEIQRKDKEFNFDLITKRYFDEVEKQERIASILFYSKLSSGSLLAILFLVVGYNYYEKIKLRKDIENELISLKITE